MPPPYLRRLDITLVEPKRVRTPLSPSTQKPRLHPGLLHFLATRKRQHFRHSFMQYSYPAIGLVRQNAGGYQ